MERGEIILKVILQNRKSAVLSPSSLGCLANISTINLTAGCSHGCLYCYTRGYSSYPGSDRVIVYANTLAQLRLELSRKRRPVKSVYFSPSSDLFQPIPQVLDLNYQILEFLFAQGIGVAFLTKGRIPEKHMELICRHSSLVRAQIGLISTDEHILTLFEPGAPGPPVRLDQLERLAAAGIITQVRVDPILPGLTDSHEAFKHICEAVSNAGSRKIAASVLFLRPAIRQSLCVQLKEERSLNELLNHYEKAEKLKIHAEHSSVLALPAETRKAILDRLRQIAAAYGIEVLACACKNPDLPAHSCSIAGDWLPRSQESLF